MCALRYLWERQRGVDERAVLASLPVPLRVKLASHLNARTLSQIPAFAGTCPATMLQLLVSIMQSRTFLPGDRIQVAARPMRALYLLKRGRVRVVTVAGELVMHLLPGSHFGEGALLPGVPAQSLGHDKLAPLRVTRAGESDGEESGASEEDGELSDSDADAARLASLPAAPLVLAAVAAVDSAVAAAAPAPDAAATAATSVAPAEGAAAPPPSAAPVGQSAPAPPAADAATPAAFGLAAQDLAEHAVDMAPRSPSSSSSGSRSSGAGRARVGLAELFASASPQPPSPSVTRDPARPAAAAAAQRSVLQLLQPRADAAPAPAEPVDEDVSEQAVLDDEEEAEAELQLRVLGAQLEHSGLPWAARRSRTGRQPVVRESERLGLVTVVALTYVDCFSVSHSDFRRVAQAFPEATARVEQRVRTAIGAMRSVLREAALARQQDGSERAASGRRQSSAMSPANTVDRPLVVYSWVQALQTEREAAQRRNQGVQRWMARSEMAAKRAAGLQEVQGSLDPAEPADAGAAPHTPVRSSGAAAGGDGGDGAVGLAALLSARKILELEQHERTQKLSVRGDDAAVAVAMGADATMASAPPDAQLAAAMAAGDVDLPTFVVGQRFGDIVAWLPDSRAARWWQFCALIVLLYSALVIPFRLAFLTSWRCGNCGNDRDAVWPSWLIVWMLLEYLLDAFWWTDIWLRRNRLAVHDGVRLETERSRLRARYQRSGGHLWDLVASVPLDVFAALGSIPGVPALQLAAALRLPRLLRLWRLREYFDALVQWMTAAATQRDADGASGGGLALHVVLTLAPHMRLLRLFVALFLTAHFCSCGLFVVSEIEPSVQRGDGQPPRTWVEDQILMVGTARARAGTGCCVHGCTHAQGYLSAMPSIFSMYLRGFYWSVASITAMVIGDVPPVTPMETAYMLLVVAVVSVFVSATAINNFTDLVAGVNSAKVSRRRACRARRAPIPPRAAQLAHSVRVNSVERHMKAHGLPQALQVAAALPRAGASASDLCCCCCRSRA